MLSGEGMLWGCKECCNIAWHYFLDDRVREGAWELKVFALALSVFNLCVFKMFTLRVLVILMTGELSLQLTSSDRL